MRVIKIFFKIIIILICLILLALIIDYARLNIFYSKNKVMYVDAFDVYGNDIGYVPQGITYSSKYGVILQTSYDSKHGVSMIFVSDFKTGLFIKSLKLINIDGSDNTNHVGGIATDENKVWITSDYIVNEYSLDDIVKTNNDYVMSEKKNDLYNRGDFCYYNDNILWIGDFFLKPFYNVPNDNPLLLGYDLSSSNDFSIPVYSVTLPKMVQGMVITDDNKFVFSRSFTNLVNSDLVIYDNIFDNLNEFLTINGDIIPYYKFTNGVSIKIPPMAEGMFYKDNELYVLFESGSKKYFYAYPKINKILKIDIEKS